LIVKDILKPLEIILNNMKVKDLIELLEDENPKAKLILEFDSIELDIDEWNIESSDELVTIKFVEK
jgi:hypothetical protein